MVHAAMLPLLLLRLFRVGNKALWAIFGMVLLLVGCAPSATPWAPTAQVTDIPTLTPTLVPTLTPTATPQVAPEFITLEPFQNTPLASASIPMVATPIPPDLPQTTWGQAMWLAQSIQRNASAVIPHNTIPYAFYTGTDSTEPRIYIHTPRLALPTILAFKAYSPRDLRAFSALDDTFHLLWIDHTSDNPTPRLLAGIADTGLIAQYGANPLSEARTFQYDAYLQPNRTLQVVWSEGDIGTRNIRTRQIDRNGRISFSHQLVNDGDYPLLINDDGTLWFYWVQQQEILWRGRMIFEADTTRLDDIERIATLPPLISGDALLSVQTASDVTTDYIFWQVERADRRVETWVTLLTDDGHSTLQQVGLSALSEASVSVGYNSGQVFETQLGDDWLAWSSVVTGKNGIVPMVGQVNDTLMIVYWQGGNIIGAQTLAENVQLSGQPTITTDRDRHLYVSYSTLGTTDYHLFMINTVP